MHCKHCGTKNEQGALYCINDGVPLTGTNGAQVVRSGSTYCRNCSHQNSPEAVYCSDCGYSMEKISTSANAPGSLLSAASENETPSLPSGGMKFQDIFLKHNLIQAAKWSGLTVIALFIISFILSSTINRYVHELIMEELSYGIGFALSADILQNLKLVTASDILLLGHMAGVSYSADVAFASFYITTTSGLFLLLALPAAVLIIAGFLMNRNQPEKTLLERLYQNLAFALTYTLFISFISLFGGASVNVPDPGSLVGDITVSASYGFFETFINALIISLIFTTAGTVLATLKSGKHEVNRNYTVSISRAAVNTVFGLLIMFFAAYVTISANDEFNETTAGERTVLSSQIGGYYWSLSHFASLKFDAGMDRENMSARYSLLGGVKVTPHDPYAEEDLKEVFGSSLWLLILIPLAIHVWTGRILLKANAGNLLYEIGAYAIAFGLVNAAIVSISRFSVTTNISDTFMVSFGFSTFAVFLLSTVIAFAAAYGGAMFFASKENGQVQQAA